MSSIWCALAWLWNIPANLPKHFPLSNRQMLDGYGMWVFQADCTCFPPHCVFEGSKLFLKGSFLRSLFLEANLKTSWLIPASFAVWSDALTGLTQSRNEIMGYTWPLCYRNWAERKSVSNVWEWHGSKADCGIMQTLGMHLHKHFRFFSQTSGTDQIFGIWFRPISNVVLLLHSLNNNSVALQVSQ